MAIVHRRRYTNMWVSLRCRNQCDMELPDLIHKLKTSSPTAITGEQSPQVISVTLSQRVDHIAEYSCRSASSSQPSGILNFSNNTCNGLLCHSIICTYLPRSLLLVLSLFTDMSLQSSISSETVVPPASVAVRCVSRLS